jgi:hypothetical protein
MLSHGFAKVPRSLQEHQYWSADKFTKGQAMVDLLFLQSFTPHEVEFGGDRMFLDNGDFAASIRFLARRWGWSVRKVASFLARLEADKFLVKKRNGTGNGSPSVYHIVDEGNYAPETYPDGNGSGNAQDTVEIRSGYKEKKGKKGEKGNTAGSAIAVEDSLSGFSHAGQDLIRRTLSAVAGTAKSRRSTQAAQNSFASELARFPKSAVITGCQAYLDRDCAVDGKNEKYLLGIVRNSAKNSEANPSAQSPCSTHKTQGQKALEKAMADLRQEHQR